MGRLTAALVLVFAGLALSAVATVPAAADSVSVPSAKKRCKTLVNRVHGKKRHVRVCKKAKSKNGHHGQPSPPPPTPAATKTLGKVTLPSAVSSLAVGEGAVWATLADNSLVRIDPNALAVTARIADPLAAEWPPLVAVGAGSVWLADAVPSAGNSNDGGALLRVDPTANRIVANVPVGRSPEGMAFTAGAVWVANHRSDTALGTPAPHPFSVSRVDTASNRETRRVVVERRKSTGESWVDYCCGPQGMAAGAGSVWVGDATPQTVYRIDPGTNNVVAAIHAPDIGDACGGLAADSSSVWVASGCSPALWRIDPLTNAVAATITLPGAADTVALGFGSVWATTSSSQFSGGEADLVRVDAASNLVVGKTGGGGALAIGEGAIWLGSGNVLFKLAPA